MEGANALALKYTGGLLLAAGLGLLVYAVVAFRRASGRARWVTTSGIVRSSRVVLSTSQLGQAYRPEILYEYSVGGWHYTSTVWAYGREGLTSKDDAQRIVARYTPGALVRVYYMPGRPRVSTREPGLRDQSLGILFGLSACAGIGLGILMLVAPPSVPGAQATPQVGMGPLSFTAYFLLLVLGVVLTIWVGRQHGVYDPLLPTLIAGGGLAVIFAMLLADGGGFTVNGVLVSAALWVLVMAFVYTGFRMGRRPAIDKLESGDSG
ncbi:MAG: DUF3592 domain-containing protein, partial [Ktedonobacterales bacterium]